MFVHRSLALMHTRELSLTGSYKLSSENKRTVRYTVRVSSDQRDAAPWFLPAPEGGSGLALSNEIGLRLNGIELLSDIGGEHGKRIGCPALPERMGYEEHASGLRDDQERS